MPDSHGLAVWGCLYLPISAGHGVVCETMGHKSQESHQQRWKQGHESGHSFSFFQLDMSWGMKIFPCVCCWT